ncbi:MAG: hypothetical protein HY875_10640 [Chloroflexi bacterium]|nr:hypothetical protein [Chloroflexota bacterium]
MDLRILTLSARPDGSSQIESRVVAFDSVEFIPGRTPVSLSPTLDVAALSFIQLPPRWDSNGPYNAPRRNLFVTLAGVLEIETSDGRKHTLEAGAALLAEDLTGDGHVTRAGEDGWLGIVARFAQPNEPHSTKGR